MCSIRKLDKTNKVQMTTSKITNSVYCNMYLIRNLHTIGRYSNELFRSEITNIYVHINDTHSWHQNIAGGQIACFPLYVD